MPSSLAMSDLSFLDRTLSIKDFTRPFFPASLFTTSLRSKTSLRVFTFLSFFPVAVAPAIVLSKSIASLSDIASLNIVTLPNDKTLAAFAIQALTAV